MTKRCSRSEIREQRGENDQQADKRREPKDGKINPRNKEGWKSGKRYENGRTWLNAATTSSQNGGEKRKRKNENDIKLHTQDSYCSRSDPL